MARNRFRLILDTHRSNFTLTQWPVTVLDPLETHNDIVEQAINTRATIDSDPHLTAQGKKAAREAKKAAAVKAITDVSTPRLAGLAADVGSHRAALLPASTEKIEARRIDFLLSHLRDRTPQEIAVFYNSATDDERLVLEEPARSVGRTPTKAADGSLAWAPLLPAATINESVIARASAKNLRARRSCRNWRRFASCTRAWRASPRRRCARRWRGRSADNRQNVSHAKNQHYVSRLYLRQFAFEAGKNPRIYAFDKTTRRVIRPSIRNIAAAMHFYESSDTGIERALGMVEDNFVPAYRLIREIDDITALGANERAAIAIFIAVQQVRTVEFRETLKSMVSGLDEWAKRHNHQLDESYTTITEEQCRDIQVASLATTAPTIAMGAAQMKWIRVHNRTATPLWTSDHPVTLYNPKPSSLMGNLGWACPGIQVFFPLSPTLALCICDPDEYQAQPSEIWTDDIEHVKLQNDLQLRHATRFVFSRSGDFNLADQVLDAYPGVGDPARKRTRS